MSSFYTTKSLGRAWLPSPVSKKRSKLHWPSASSNEKPTRWSKIHERFVLLAVVILLGIWWCVFGNENLLSTTTLYNPWLFAPGNRMSAFAYVTYASSPENLCSSLMQLESLNRLGAQAARVLLFPAIWTAAEGTSIEAHLIQQAQETHGATLQPVVTPHQNVDLAIIASRQTAYKRVIALDLDSTILRSMDEVFFSEGLREGNGAAIMLSPSQNSSKVLQGEKELEEVLAKGVWRIPGTLRTSEFRWADHSAYLSSLPGNNSWSARAALAEATLVHFADGSPWKPMLDGRRKSLQPKCPEQDQCEDRQVWQWLYNDFRARRKTVCGPQFNEWEVPEALNEADHRVIPLLDRVNGIGANSGAVR